MNMQHEIFLRIFKKKKKKKRSYFSLCMQFLRSREQRAIKFPFIDVEDSSRAC